MCKVFLVKMIGGTKRDIVNMVLKLEKLKKTDDDLNDYQFIVLNDRIDFLSPQRFIKEMKGIVTELEKLVEKKVKK
jgi:hypothetical protein